MTFSRVFFNLLEKGKGRKTAIEVLVKAFFEKRKIKEEIGFKKQADDTFYQH